PGQRVREYLSGHAAVVDVGDHNAVVDSMAPIAIEAGDGWLPVDLDLVRSGAGFVGRETTVDVRVPPRAGETAAVGRTGLGMIPLVGARATDAELVDGRVFWTSAATDTDVIAMPIPGGLEVGYFLRSPEAPEELVLGLALPDGAVAQRGLDPMDGVRITRAGQTIARITQPVAVDASGEALPVRYAIRDGDLVMRIDHRAADVEYPIAVDPRMDQEWQDRGDPYTAWTPNVVHYWMGPAWSLATGDVGVGRGLNIWKDSGEGAPDERADYYRTAPGNSHIEHVNVRSIQWWLAKSCLRIGVNRSAGGTWPWIDGWYEDCRDSAGTIHNGSFYGVGVGVPTGARTADTWSLVLTHYHPPQFGWGWRGYHMAHFGNVEFWYSDFVKPSLGTVTWPASTWYDPTKTSRTWRITSSDAGVGLKSTGIDGSWGTAEYDIAGSNNCSGDYNSICPPSNDKSGDLRGAPDGEHTVKAKAHDLVHTPATESVASTVRLDRGFPKAELSGASVTAADAHKAVGDGRHALTVTGSDPKPAGVNATSGARASSVDEGGSRESRYASATGCTKDCTAGGAYSFNASAPPQPAGQDGFADVALTKLEEHEPERGGPWARHPGSTAGVNAVITAGTRVRRDGSNGAVLHLLDGRPASADYDLSAELHLPTVDRAQGIASLAGRHQTNGEHYMAHYYGNAGQFTLGRRNADGSTTSFGAVAATVAAGGTYRMMLRMRGNWIGLFVDGKLVLDAIDAAIPAAGQAGVGFWAGATPTPASDVNAPQFDNLVVTERGHAEGRHRLDLGVADGVAHIATNPVDLIVDRTPPRFSSPPDGTLRRRFVGAGTHHVDVAAEDPGTWPNVAGIGRIAFLVDDVRKQVSSPSAPSRTHAATFSFDASAGGGYAEGLRRIEVAAFDDAKSPSGGDANVPAEDSFDVVVDRTGPTFDTPTGPLWDSRNGTADRRFEGLDRDSYDLHVVARDGTGGGDDWRSGAARVDIEVRNHDGTQVVQSHGDEDPQDCPDGNCFKPRDFTFDPDSVGDGEYQIWVRAYDTLNQEGRLVIPVTVDRRGDVYRAEEYEGDPTAGAPRVAVERHRLNTTLARRDEAAIVTTRRATTCSQDANAQCAEMRTLMRYPEQSTTQTEHLGIVRGTTVDDDRIDTVAAMRDPVLENLGAAEGTGPISDQLRTWQTPPPGHADEYAYHEDLEQAEVDGESTTVTRRWYLDSATQLPLRNTVLVGSEVELDLFYTYDRQRLEMSQVPAGEFAVERAATGRTITIDYATDPPPDPPETPGEDTVTQQQATTWRRDRALNVEPAHVAATLVDPDALKGLGTYGIPLTASERTELAQRGAAADAIDTAVEPFVAGHATARNHYAGAWLDQAAGGLIRVAFTQNAQAYVDQLKASFPYPARLSAVTVARTEQALESLRQNVQHDMAWLTNRIEVTLVYTDVMANV
ncbi:MAG: hypothetical protein M3320_02465, partial [Actinomycetota bacterium]|nr:hypothetical protein [Actinomycetota bacterium]